MQRLSKTIFEYKFILLVIFLASFLRFYNIQSTPPSLNWDEISHGYNAYSILKTGQDEWGQVFPAIFRAYGDYKLPVYVYLTALSELFFGLNSLSVRLISVLAGITTVFYTYLLVSKLFDKKVGILTALLVAVEPWSLFLSRGAFEANLGLAFVVSGVYFFLLGIKNAKFLLASALLLGLSVWTYNSDRVFVPLYTILLVFLFRRDLLRIWSKQKMATLISGSVLVLLFVPMFFQLLNTSGQARYSKVAILDNGAISSIEQKRILAGQTSFSRLIYNKPVYFASQVGKNIISHFSPDYLFFKGGSNYQFSVPNFGLLYIINIPLLIAGLYVLLRRKDEIAWLILGWALLAVVPSSLTREAPHVLRSITLLPIPMIICALGFVWIWQRIKKLQIILQIAYLFALGLLTFNYLNSYFGNYRSNYSWSWQYGYRDVVDFAKDNYNKYDQIIVTKKYGEPHEFVLFYWPWDPEKYKEDPNMIRFYQSNWYWVDRFDKFYFVNDWNIPKDGSGGWAMESGGEVPLEGKTLLFTSPGNFPVGWSLLKTINFLDGRPAFDVLEKNV